MTKKPLQTKIITREVIENKILLVRGKKVMLDRDLARLYGVTTKALNQAVKRNIERFPEDFMFQLTKEELENWMSQFAKSNRENVNLRSRSQFVTLKRGQNIKYFPRVFTEHGILMLSSVLNSPMAIQANIQIMRIFVKLRELMIEHRDLREKIEKMENTYDHQFKIVFDAIKRILKPSEPPKKQIGFHVR